MRTWYRRFRAFTGKGWVTERTTIVATNREEICEAPIFVIGTHRSGTSLLRRVIDSHRNIACPPESFFLSHFAPLLADPETFVGLGNLGFETDEAITGLRYCASYFHECYRRAKGKPRWADKTPQYALHLETLYALFKPRVQFVILFRHPMDVAFSIWKRGWSFEGKTGDLLIDTCNYVKKCGLAQHAFLASHAGICFSMHYDDLARFPEKTLRDLCGFLREPWDPNMLLFHRMGHDFGTEDPIVRGTGGFVGSFENWKEWNPSQIEVAASCLRDLMTLWGYSLTSPFRSN
jgi:hypothetical protein